MKKCKWKESRLKRRGSSGLVSREGVNPFACPSQRFRFSLIEIIPKNERTHENAATNAGFNQSSQTWRKLGQIRVQNG
jgi:hypothetical protein